MDYEPVSEIFVLMAGPFPRVCVDITIIDDNADEENEMFILDIANNNNWPEFRSTARVTIVDNGKYPFPKTQMEIDAFLCTFFCRGCSNWIATD